MGSSFDYIQNLGIIDPNVYWSEGKMGSTSIKDPIHGWYQEWIFDAYNRPQIWF